MTNSHQARFASACALLLAGVNAMAHITLPPGGAPAGSMHAASFHVGHACAGSASTIGVKVRLPAGFMLADAEPRAGWKLTKGAQEVSWESISPQSALPTAEKAEFVVRGRLTDSPGTLWFKVLQTCDKGSADWAELPGADGSARPAFPAVRLDVLAPGVAAVDIRDAWSRFVAAPQGTAAVYAKLNAPAGARLVGVSSAVSESAEIHEMRMDGDVMRMRALDSGLELPAGKSIELAPGGYHVMLVKLRRSLALGDSVPVTFRFIDSAGNPVSREVEVTVKSSAEQPGADHRH
jgi:copper(I)-binding protein